MHNWTPTVYDNNGTLTPVTMTVRAVDNYFGTDKFWFWEDCNFTVPTTTNICDNEEGGRVVFRHCTMNGGSIGSHGMEGPRAPGVRAQEVYNNYFNITNRPFAQTRSGTILFFNNLSVDANETGWPFHDYRAQQVQNNWGGADGTNRYDSNGALVYSGTVTAVAPNQLDWIEDSSQPNFNNINLTDGTYYSVNDTDAAANTSFGGPPETADPGWKYKHAGVSSVSGTRLNLTVEDFNIGSPHWAVGHHYEIRKVIASFGQVGLGKGTMMSPKGAGKGSYETYPWPATSGTKITFPNAGYPKEPAYSWNNYNVSTSSYLGFDRTNCKTLLEGRDFFSLGHITPETTQKVGYPAQDYAHATTSYPKIGPGQTIPYTPYIYPHPLVSGNPPPPPTPTPSPTPTATPEAPQNVQILEGG